MLISLREFARRNGVDVAAISRAVKAGRIPSVDGKIDAEEAQSVWDRVKDRAQVGRKLKHGGVDPVPVNTQIAVDPAPVNTSATVDPDAVNTPGNHARRVAVTIAINGAEEMALAKTAADLGVTLQSVVLSRCGVQMWRLEAPARAAHRQPIRKALERRSVTLLLAQQDHESLKARARAAGLSLPQFIRTQCGYPVRHSSMPGTDERDREEDEAWEILRRLGVGAEPYFDD